MVTRTTLYWLGTDQILHTHTGVTITPPPPTPTPPVGAPIARITITSTNYLVVSLSSSTSSEQTAGASITSRAWDFGDGTTDTSVAPTHTYASAGTFPVKLTVTDSLGVSNTTTQNITVAAAVNNPPIGKITITSNDGYLSIHASAAGSYDPDAGDSIVTSEWNFGDGGASVQGPEVDHVYTAAGTYTVTYKPIDMEGAYKLVTQSVTVAAAPVVTPDSKVYDPDAAWTFSIPSNIKQMKYTDYQSAGDLDAVVNAAASAAGTQFVLIMPDGFDSGRAGSFSDMNQATFGIFNNYFVGFINSKGVTAGNSNVGIRKQSLGSGPLAAIAGYGSGATTSYYVCRPNGMYPSGTRHPTFMRGMTLFGQPQQTITDYTGIARPASYGGWFNYHAQNALWQELLLIGTSWGDLNSPPGETFALNDYATSDCTYRGLEIDGRALDGTTFAGAALFGTNASTGTLTLNRCYFHDSYASHGFTASFTGQSNSSGSPYTGTIITTDVRSERNGNHDSNGGRTAVGFNHESVSGPVTHNHPTVRTTGWTNIGTCHFSFNNGAPAGNNTAFVIHDPDVDASPTFGQRPIIGTYSTYHGAANQQTSPPTITKNGQTMTANWFNGTTPITSKGGGKTIAQLGALDFVVQTSGHI